MTHRDNERERRWRETENDNDWDWYYYEYRYLPYDLEESSSNRNMYGRENDYRSGEYNHWNRGPYAGVGPRGYRRSDDRIREDVNDRLTWHGQIDATEIQVEANDGIVTLSGTVNSRYEKRMAENIAESVWGVSDVQNNLKIERQTTDWNRGWPGEGMGGETGEGMRNQVRQGMKVLGRDGTDVGEVKEVRSNDFLVDRSMARDVYIPFNAGRMSGGQIRLNVRADEVDEQDWPMPDLIDMDTNEGATSRSRR